MQLPMKMGAFSHRVKFLIVAVIISVCVLLYFVVSKADDDARQTNLVSEADDVRILTDCSLQERDRMKLNVSGLEGGASKVMERATH